MILLYPNISLLQAQHLLLMMKQSYGIQEVLWNRARLNMVCDVF